MSIPYNVSPPTLRQDGDKLVAANGSWMCDSGPVGGYLFDFHTGDGPSLGGAPPPQRETWEKAHARLAGRGNTLDSPRVGRTYTALVWAVTFSGAWGTEPAWAEWSVAAVSNPVTVQAVTPPTAQANVPAAIAELVEQGNELRACYAWTHKTAASHGAVVGAVNRNLSALRFLRGENP